MAHRDIKPDNIGIAAGKDRRLQLVLFDFSLARTPPENLHAGTRPYLDPFLSLRRPPRWDLYAERFAVAVTLYELLTRRLPFWGDAVSDQASLECEATIESEHFDPALRDGLTAFFAKALRREARERYDNAAEMLRAWRRVFDEARRPGHRGGRARRHRPAGHAPDDHRRAWVRPGGPERPGPDGHPYGARAARRRPGALPLPQGGRRQGPQGDPPARQAPGPTAPRPGAGRPHGDRHGARPPGARRASTTWRPTSFPSAPWGTTAPRSGPWPSG